MMQQFLNNKKKDNKPWSKNGNLNIQNKANKNPNSKNSFHNHKKPPQT